MIQLEKNEDGHAFTQDYLLNAIQQLDKRMSGYMTRQEIDDVIGPKWLNLGVSD